MAYLRDYQKKAIQKIYDFLNLDSNKAKIYLSSGLGKTIIIISAIQRIIQNNKSISFAILSPSRSGCEQIKFSFMQLVKNVEIVSYVREMKRQRVLITAYQDAIKNQLDTGVFGLVICDEAQFLRTEKMRMLFSNERTKYLGMLQNIETVDGCFRDAMCLYSYTIKDAVKDGYVEAPVNREKDFVEKFLIELLHYQGYHSID